MALLEFLPRPVRYGISAGLNWLVDFLVFIAIFQVTGIPLGVFVARVTGGVFAFLTHRWFSFDRKGSPTQREIFGFVALWIVNYGIVVGLLVVLPGSDNLWIVAAKFSVELVVFAANYLFLKRLFIPSRVSEAAS